MRTRLISRCRVVAPPSWRPASLRCFVFCAPLRRLSILTLLSFALLLASPVAAQRDPEVDVRARLFPQVTAGVAAIKSRIISPAEAQALTAGTSAAPGTQAVAADAATGATPSVKPAAASAAKPAAAEAGESGAQGARVERLYYLLIPALRTEGAEGGATVLVFRDDGTRVAQIPAPPTAQRAKAAGAATSSGAAGSGGATDASTTGATVAELQAVPPAQPLVVYGHDFDVDAQGRVFIADRAANAVKIFNPDGTPAGAISIPAPTSLAALANGEVAVTSLRANKLVTVYAERPAPATPTTASATKTASAPETSTWRAIREFGEPADIADPDAPADLKRFLNIGRLARDPDNHIYYAFAYAPEPTVRKYDAFGYKLYETELATLDFFASAQSARRNIDRLGQSRFSLGSVINPGFTATVTALAADPATQDLWVALGAQLLHFGPDGVRRETYRLFTRDGVRVEASAILVEPDRLIVASDTQGVFEFPRPDKSRRRR